jgi:5-formyltetrahydrofolate cyclo-ligase
VRVFLPRFRAPDSIVFARFESWECLELGRFGILEPSAESALAAPESLSAAVLPGVAFDLDGFRLGRGRAVYDRCFSAKATRPRLIGIAFDWQLIERVPREVHDLAMDLVITESRRVEPRKSTR